MAGGIKGEYDKIKATDVIEFWQLYKMWQERLKRETELYKQKTKK